MLSKKDMQAFLAEEEAKLAEDLSLVADLKNAAKEMKIKVICTIVVALLSTVLSSAWAIGSEYDREKGRKYEEAKVLQEKEMYKDAKEVYDGLYGYKDSDSLMRECDTQLELLETKKTYKNAVTRFDAGDYKEAALLFTSIKDYEDAKNKAAESYYKYGEVSAKNSDYENAYNAFNNAGDYQNAKELAAKYKFAVVGIGQTIAFGKYEQDNNTTNGAEDLVWYVLYKEQDKVLLLSKYLVEKMAFDETLKLPNTETKPFTYENSTIRKFVNETFYNAAFSEAEKKAIIPLTIAENDAQGVEIAKSENKVFIPTYEMIEKYVTKSTMKTAETTKHVNPNATYSTRKMTWWTSSINQTGTESVVISNSGVVSKAALSGVLGVRPAIWVDFVE